jgi:hypothetical protein
MSEVTEVVATVMIVISAPCRPAKLFRAESSSLTASGQISISGYAFAAIVAPQRREYAVANRGHSISCLGGAFIGLR